MRELALLFLRLGLTAFGGPAAHIALMNDEVVQRRGWMTQQQFLDLVSAANLIPGPNSTEVAIHIGHRRSGWAGLLVAGSLFIVPAAVMVGLLAFAYVRYGRLPAVAGMLDGVKPVVIVIIGQALWRFARTIFSTARSAICALTALLLSALGVNELVVLAAGGVMGLLSARNSAALLLSPPMLSSSSAIPVAAAAPALSTIFLAFLKIGSVLFGSGYVLLAFLRTDLVERHHWLTQRQLLDAIAAGQITPGPLFTTATFVGYLLGGWSGAAMATIGIFLPAFFFVAITAPLLAKLQASSPVRRVLDGLNSASFALMAVVSWQLTRAALTSVAQIAVAATALILILRFPKLNSAWLVLGGGACGAFFF